MKKKILLMLLCLSLFLATYTSCSSSDYEAAISESDDYVEAYDGRYEASDIQTSLLKTASNTNEEDDGTVKEEEEDNSKKLVYTCDIDVETLEFDSTVEKIRTAIEKYDGFVQSSSLASNSYSYSWGDREDRTMNITVRIPSESYSAFLSFVQGEGHITSLNENVDNITKKYSDVSTTIESLEIQEERILGLMEKAETLQDMLTLEDRLTEVQNELKQYKNSLSTMDTDVAYSTFNIEVQEVYSYTEGEENVVEVKPYGTRFVETIKTTSSNFVQFIGNFVLFIIKVLPYVILFGVPTAAIIIGEEKRKQRKGLKLNKARKQVQMTNQEGNIEKEQETGKKE